jgi:hypothetical protein
LSVTEIKRTSLLDCPQRLRELADDMEKNGLKTVICVVGYPEGKVAVRGYGERTSALEASGWLMRALTVMTEGCAADDSNIGTTPGY